MLANRTVESESAPAEAKRDSSGDRPLRERAEAKVEDMRVEFASRSASRRENMSEISAWQGRSGEVKREERESSKP